MVIGKDSFLEEDNVLIIEPGRVEKNYFRDIWNYRELFFFLSWRDILIRYKQTVIGVAWSVLRPFLTMIVFTIVFEKLAKLPPPAGVPYPILIFAALLPWQFFANSFAEASNSLLTNAPIFTKVYFPRLIMPTSSVIVSLIDFLISFTILILMMFWYQFWPTWRIIFLPFFLFMASLVSLGAGYYIAALNVRYRDFRHVVPFIMQFGLYISPVGFSSSIVPERWRFWYSLNPMVGVIDGFRFSLLGGENHIYWPGFCVTLFLSFLIFIWGLYYFRRVERTFADVI